MKIRICGDCARFIPTTETDGECLRHGAVCCYGIVLCEDFEPIADHPTEKGGAE